MKIWRRILLLGVALILLFSLTAAASEEESITIHLWTCELKSTEKRANVFNKLIEEFEKLNPNVKVDVTTMSVQDLKTVLPMALSGGTGPEIGEMDVGPTQLGALVNAGLVYNLTDEFKARGWDKRLMSSAVKMVTYDGQIYGVPYQQEALGLWYNAAIFRDLGIDPPNTWQDFINAAQKSKSAGIIPISHGAKVLNTSCQLLASIVFGLIPPEIVNDTILLSGKLTWKDDPRFLQAVKTLKKWIDDGWLPPHPNALSHQDAVRLFLRGDAAMGALGPWNTSLAVEAWEDGKVEPIFVPMPAQDTSFPLTNQGAAGSSLFIKRNIDKDKVKASIDLLEYLLIRSESVKEWLFESFILPLTVEDITEEEVDNLAFRSVIEAHTYLGQRGGVNGLWLDCYISPKASEVFLNGQQRIFDGSWTPEQFIERISEVAIQERKKADNSK